jgi:hypothetical protein
MGGGVLRTPVKTPIIVDEEGDLAFFRNVESVERYLEATDVQDGRYSAYDSEGRRLRLTTRQELRPVLFGLFRVRSERVVVEREDTEPEDAEALRSLLRGFLRAVDTSSAEVDDSVPLRSFLDLAIEKVGFTT